MSRPTSGLTLAGLVSLLAAVAVLVAVILPVLARSGWDRRRAGCALQLSAAAKGMLQYAQDYDGAFPTRGFGPGTKRFDVIGRGIIRPLRFDHSNSRNLFLAVRLKYITPETLICPDTEDSPASLQAAGKTLYDFNSGHGGDYVNRFSYSYHLQFRRRDDRTPGYPLTDRSHPLMAVLADRTPLLSYVVGRRYSNGCSSDACGAPVGIPVDRANSRNHDRAGQNVAHVAGHVAWADVPIAGVAGDNIYTVWSGPDRTGGRIKLTSMPQGPTDSFLVP